MKRSTLLVERLRSVTPSAVWDQIRGAYCLGNDVYDVIRGIYDPLLPPARLRAGVGPIDSSTFVTLARAHLEQFQTLGGLRPTDQILEIGCGCGRLARAFASFLSEAAHYTGIDVDRDAIEWCRSAYSSRENFQFLLVDVANEFYNPAGRESGSRVRLPVLTGMFDFVIMTSVMTHLLPNDASNYLAEAARVLRPGGRAWVTFFLWNEEAELAEERDPTGFLFRYPFPGGHRVMHPRQPTVGICFDERWVRAELARHGLSTEWVRYGSWGRSTTPLEFQDVVLVTKGVLTAGAAQLGSASSVSRLASGPSSRNSDTR